MPSLLVAIHDPERRRALHAALADGRHHLKAAGSATEALEALACRHVDVAFVDPRLDVDGAVVGAIRRGQTTPRTLVVRIVDGDAATSATLSRRADATLQAEAAPAKAAALVERLLPRSPTGSLVVAAAAPSRNA